MDLEKNTIKEVSQEELSIVIEKSYKTNVSKSVRRVLFNSINEKLLEKGHWHVDIMSGMGTCIILKYNHRFFAISAKHVFKDLKDKEGNYFNDSPFWMPVGSQTKWKTIHDFFMPKKFWKIGELINIEDRVLLNDIYMIELYPPMGESFPDYYLDLDENKVLFSTKDDFFDGRYLLISGYPFCKNYFDWDIEHEDENMTHGTSIWRHTVIGIYRKDSGLGYISFENTEGETTKKNSNGMSGGIVYDLQEESDETKICGMILNLSNNMCTFLPSYIMIDAIKNYKNAPFEIIDPAEKHIKEPEDEEGIARLNKFYEALSRRR